MNISELTRWDDHIYLIARNDRVEGGTSGVANTQAKQLANRTRWLKTLIESAEDYREYTFYKSEQDPDGTISGRANTPEGKIFRVTQSINDTLAFIYYLNYQGQAIPLTALLGRGSITNNIRQYPSLPIAQHDIEAGNILDGSKFYITNPDNDILVDEFVNNGGAPEATGRIVLDGSLLKPLTDAVIYSESDEFSRSGYLSAVISSDRFIINAVRYDGSFYVPELKAPGLNVDELNSIVHELKFLDPVEFLRSGYLSAVLSADRYILSAVALDSDVYIPVISDSVGVIESREFARSGFINAVISGDRFIMAARTTDGNAQEGSREIRLPTEFERSGYRYADASADMFVTDGDRLLTEAWRRDVYYARVVGAYSQLFKFDANGAETQLTHDNANVTNVRDSGEEVQWQSDVDTGVKGGLWFTKKATFDPHPVFPRNIITLWGHSFLQNPRLANKLYKLTGMPVWNFGRSNITSKGAALRQGGQRIEVWPLTGKIPATTDAVQVTPSSPGPLELGAKNYALNGQGYFRGQKMWVNWYADNTLKITRYAAGAEITVPAAETLMWIPQTQEALTDIDTGQVITPQYATYDRHAEGINIFWIGRNNSAGIAQVISDLKAMVEKVKASSKYPRIVVLADFMDAGQTNGTAGRAQIFSLNAAYKRAYPEYYCEIDGVDILQNFINHANPNYADDVTDVAAGTTPRSLRYDDLHPSQVLQENALHIGADVNAEFIVQFLTKKGWL
ncbi:TPA: hypothetical protein MXB82_001489 [Klebsiella pneumoniae]|uniref:Putative prophage endo-N-neuraminidase n=2 Tax=Klebsiella pneumoniae TaxID=573 RepID=A0A486NB80_KLEPN|nr:hypothetical protein [Klebsiella pneumoniae]KDM21095.1 hypothetical protein AE15_01071 [Klebsiella pneumoniae UCI 56]KMX53112.1 hypothetical protein SL48_01196 [Klebsiella pneumoniae]MBG2360329.1 hypothetical protein [Klebsiella pneumoniae]QLU46653.1 hypothetical protein HV247_16220 [Klebsiella pneumoniae]VGL53809.1 putative prophage endo-N-neuraminidase [Klebsiella pneumoniae]